MDPFKKRRIGQTSIEVTQLGLGGTAYAGMYSAVSEHNARAAIQAAHRLGIRYFDTAPMYGHGSSEARLGSSLASYVRAEIVISTKVGRVLEPRSKEEVEKDVFADPLPFSPVFDFSYDGVMRSFEQSLRRLLTEYIDILLIHDPDEGTSLSIGHDPLYDVHLRRAMEGAYPALASLRSQGLVKAIGVGMNQWEMLCDFARQGDFDCFLLAGRYTLLDQGALAKLLPLCVQRKISIIIGGPYNSGILATGAVPGATYNYAPARPEILSRTDAIESLCRQYAIPLQAAALQFAFGHPAVATVIPGARSAAEVEAAMRFSSLSIPSDFWKELNAGGLIDAAAPLP